MELLKQQKLLELLSPYANKTLSEGCIMNTNMGVYIITHKKGNKFYLRGLGEKGEYVNIKKLEKAKDIIVFGHIGITTVLKCIASKLIINFEYANAGDLLIFEIGLGGTRYIPNKELYLYTKQELEELYNLLIKKK